MIDAPMPLPAPSAARSRVHTRSIELNGFRREDGLFEVEGHLTDVRPEAISYPGGGRAAGDPIHSMWLRLRVDGTAAIVAVELATDAAPFETVCGSIAPAYQGLVGLRIGPGFRGRVQRLLAGVRGCTHQTELLMAMATAVLQTLAGNVEQPADQKPFSLDGCHALATDGPQVAAFYPRWVRKAEA